MKKLKTPNSTLMSNYIKNITFLTLPMLYILYIFTASFKKMDPGNVGSLIITTFLTYILIHISAYKYLRKDNYVEKIKLQVILTNLSLEIAIFLLATKKIGGYIPNTPGIICAIACWIILTVIFTRSQIKDCGSFKKAFSGSNLYETLIIIAMITFFIFFVGQIFILWTTPYIGVPFVTGSIMLGTIYRNGIVHESSEFRFNLFTLIPILIGIGIIFHFFYEKVFGFPLWKIISVIAVVSFLVFAFDRIRIHRQKSQAEVDGAGAAHA